MGEERERGRGRGGEKRRKREKKGEGANYQETKATVSNSWSFEKFMDLSLFADPDPTDRRRCGFVEGRILQHHIRSVSQVPVAFTTVALISPTFISGHMG